MTDLEIKAYIDHAIKETVAALKRDGVLKDGKEKTYSEVSYLLTSYYQGGEKIPKMEKALDTVKDDSYFAIIPKYYEKGIKIEMIAQQMGVDISTIVRNKKRLCMEIYIALI